ncbi:MAG: GNAT family N-acetyltransferase [Nocardioides sp.]
MDRPGPTWRGADDCSPRRGLDWAASQGATTAYLQVLSDNEPALRLYERLGFTTHHRYRYLAAPAR